MNTQVKLIVSGVVALTLLIVGVTIVQFKTVQGNEMGVMETWLDGVVEEPLQPKTHFLIPGFSKKVYVYDMSSRVYVMNDKSSTVEFAEGREKDSYTVQSAEGQDMHISLNVRWRIDPEKLVHLHKTIRLNFEEKIIRPVLMRVVKDCATVIGAIDAYSGPGLVSLQALIQSELTAPEGEMRANGIIVENFVIEHIKLDDKYVEEIKGRQVAVQGELRAKQEEKRAMAEANKAKAEARADYETQVVQAERDKQVGVLEAEKSAEQEVLKAEAEKRKVILSGEAEKESGVLRAEAILAIGTAEAEAKKLQLQAYAVEGAEAYVRIEISKNMAGAFKNISGYLPETMQIHLLSESFMTAIEGVIKPSRPLAPSRK